MTGAPRPRSQSRVIAGLLAFAIGFLLLAAGLLQRHAGSLSWGGRYEPAKKLAREEDPGLFDRVTWGLAATGGILLMGGLLLAYHASAPASRAGESVR